jgi:hypothetical protein
VTEGILEVWRWLLGHPSPNPPPPTAAGTAGVRCAWPATDDGVGWGGAAGERKPTPRSPTNDGPPLRPYPRGSTQPLSPRAGECVAALEVRFFVPQHLLFDLLAEPSLARLWTGVRGSNLSTVSGADSQGGDRVAELPDRDGGHPEGGVEPAEECECRPLVWAVLRGALRFRPQVEKGSIRSSRWTSNSRSCEPRCAQRRLVFARRCMSLTTSLLFSRWLQLQEEKAQRQAQDEILRDLKGMIRTLAVEVRSLWAAHNHRP